MFEPKGGELYSWYSAELAGPAQWVVSMDVDVGWWWMMGDVEWCRYASSSGRSCDDRHHLASSCWINYTRCQKKGQEGSECVETYRNIYRNQYKPVLIRFIYMVLCFNCIITLVLLQFLATLVDEPSHMISRHLKILKATGEAGELSVLSGILSARPLIPTRSDSWIYFCRFHRDLLEMPIIWQSDNLTSCDSLIYFAVFDILTFFFN